MILNNLLVVVTALLLPASLVVAAPGAPSEPQAQTLEVTPRVSTATAEKSKHDTAQCKFLARVNEKCESPYAACMVTISSFTDSAGNVVNRRADSLPIIVDEEMDRVTGMGPEFWADVYNAIATFTDGFESWTHTGPSRVGEFVCTSDGSTGSAGSRSQEISCSFQCSPHHASNTLNPPANPSKRTLTQRNTPPALPDILAAPPVNAIPALAGYTDIPYAHGWCSFKMQLIDQCAYNPSEHWHPEMLGMLASIQDAEHKTVVEYPEGAGRIDRGAVRLLGMGDFRLAWNNPQKKMYFMFNQGWWASDAPHDPETQRGYCNWTAWSRPELVCVEEKGTQYRVSYMGCIFRC